MEADMTWRAANSLLKLRSQIDLLAPNRDKSSDGTIGDEAHQTRTSDHNPWVKDGKVGVVTALDITHDPKNGIDTYKLAEHLRQTKDTRIKYVISNKKIFSFEVDPWNWRPYNGENPHDQHIHISVRPLKSLYDWDKPWDIGDQEPNPNADPVPDHPVLGYGSTGEAVGKLQDTLLRIKPEFKPDERHIVTKIVDAALGTKIDTEVPWFGPLTQSAVKDFQKIHNLKVDGIVGPYTWQGLEGTTGPAQKKVNRNIIATVFGGKEDPNKSAYTNKLLNNTDYYVALPYRFTGKRPVVRVTNRINGVSASGSVEDIGPWNTNDPYWTKIAGRPQAESGTDMKGRKTNGAGIDLSPALAKALEINGKGIVDWSFED